MIGSKWDVSGYDPNERGQDGNEQREVVHRSRRSGEGERRLWHISIDHLPDAGVLPVERTRSGEFSWAEMRVVDQFELFMTALNLDVLSTHAAVSGHIHATASIKSWWTPSRSF